MKKVVLIAVALLALLVAVPSQAQHHDPRWGVNSNPYSPHYGAHSYNRWGHPYRHYYNRGKKYRTSDLAIAGGIAYILGRMSVAPVQHQPSTQVIYATPNTQYRRTRICTIREVYDSRGVLISQERVCR